MTPDEPAVDAAPLPAWHPDALPPIHPGMVIRKNPRLPFAGYRLQLPAGPASVSSRLALVEGFDGIFIGELTVRGQKSWAWFGMAAEVSGAAGVSDIWGAAGLGNTRIDLAALFGPAGTTHALGLQVTLASGAWDRPDGQLSFWGTVPNATVPTFGAALAWSATRGTFAWHLHAGFRSQSYYAIDYSNGIFDLAASAATVQPLGKGWFGVGELELLTGPSPVHLRILVRRDLGHGWQADGGLALPFPGMVTDPSIQALGQIYRTF
ncbi:hypothetical protein LBMAG42_12220 [Deltaproteobacteria bacterium]|nr:hypothetical protein LBMAG42_12220 [Deltaproteobacteria bacterium]